MQPLRGLVEVEEQSGGWSAVTGEISISVDQRIRTGALSSARLAFQNGSQATLGPNTEITVDELDFRSEYGSVALTQEKGESENQVATYPKGEIRYRVDTPVGSGEARGTNFSIRVTPDQGAYFSVQEGSLAVTGQGKPPSSAQGRHQQSIPTSRPASLPCVFRVRGQSHRPEKPG